MNFENKKTKKNISENYYNEDYFNWQKDIGAFGGIADLFKFEQSIKPKDTILDFGCGGGYLLKNISANKKYGVEINLSAHPTAESNGIIVFDNIDALENNSMDKIISNHALEHVLNPLETLTKLKEKLKESGEIIFVVPHEDTRGEWNSNDINMHLYTWNQMTLGNLFKQVGYKVISVEAIQHQWPSDYIDVVEKHGWKKFHTICKKTARKNNNYQIKIVAIK